jgi:hypothetical protein
VLYVKCACAQLVRDELMALMCLACSTDAGGIYWPGDLANGKALPLDKVAAFLTRISNFIPLDDLRKTHPSESAGHLASLAKKTAQEALHVAQEASGSPAQLSIQGLVDTKKEDHTERKRRQGCKSQKKKPWARRKRLQCRSIQVTRQGARVKQSSAQTQRQHNLSSL